MLKKCGIASVAAEILLTPKNPYVIHAISSRNRAKRREVNNSWSIFSPIAQSVERVTVNHHVPGSSPGWGANNSKGYGIFRNPFCLCRTGRAAFCSTLPPLRPGVTARGSVLDSIHLGYYCIIG